MKNIMAYIGSKYKDNKSELKQKISGKKIFVLEDIAKNNACYFCGKRINGKMKILIDFEITNSYETETEYYLDFKCYRKELN